MKPLEGPDDIVGSATPAVPGRPRPQLRWRGRGGMPASLRIPPFFPAAALLLLGSPGGIPPVGIGKWPRGHFHPRPPGMTCAALSSLRTGFSAASVARRRVSPQQKPGETTPMTWGSTKRAARPLRGWCPDSGWHPQGRPRRSMGTGLRPVPGPLCGAPLARARRRSRPGLQRACPSGPPAYMRASASPTRRWPPGCSGAGLIVGTASPAAAMRLLRRSAMTSATGRWDASPIRLRSSYGSCCRS